MPDPDRLQHLSALYADTSATSLDGFHMRHPSMISRQGAVALSYIIALIELLGKFPSQIEWFVMALLAKLTGGFRPIGIFPMMYRLYGRIRLPIVQAWELEHDLDAFSCGPGKAAADTVWRQSIEAETAVALNGAAAAALLDMEKFYEMFNRTKLWLRGRQLGFNLTILRVALVAYSHARIVTLNGLAAESVWATKGIIAGCSFARAIVRLYCLPLVSVVTSTFPKAQFDFYIDDITVGMQVEKDDHAVSSIVDYLSDAVRFLVSCIHSELDCRVAIAKRCGCCIIAAAGG